MRKILNLTQHKATPEQIAAGVVEPPTAIKQTIKRLLTFEQLPAWGDIVIRAEELAKIASHVFLCELRGEKKVVMIGGAPYLMAPLQRALKQRGFTVVYAFSKRTVEETQQPDGTVEKKIIFKHIGFIEVP